MTLPRNPREHGPRLARRNGVRGSVRPSLDLDARDYGKVRLVVRRHRIILALLIPIASWFSLPPIAAAAQGDRSVSAPPARWRVVAASAPHDRVGSWTHTGSIDPTRAHRSVGWVPRAPGTAVRDGHAALAPTRRVVALPRVKRAVGWPVSNGRARVADASSTAPPVGATASPCLSHGHTASCRTTISSNPQRPARVVLTGASVRTVGATVTTKICTIGSPVLDCLIATTKYVWSNNPDGGASETTRLCTAGPVRTCGARRSPVAFLLRCGPTATSCVRSVLCTVAADQVGANCGIGVVAGYGPVSRPSRPRVIVLYSYPPASSAGYFGPPPPQRVGWRQKSGGGDSPGIPPPPLRGGPSGPTRVVVSVNTPPATSAQSSKVSTSTSLTVAVSAVTGGQWRLTATVLPVPDGGAVSFAANGRVISGCEAIPVNTSTGKALCHARLGSAGTARLQAAFSGDSNFVASHSTPIDVPLNWIRALERSPRVSGGSVTSEVNCAQRSSGCSASVIMIAGTGGAGSGATAAALPTTVGEKTLTIPAGRTVSVTITPGAAARAGLPQGKPLEGQEVVSVTIGGQRVVVTTGKFTLQP